MPRRVRSPVSAARRRYRSVPYIIILVSVTELRSWPTRPAEWNVEPEVSSARSTRTMSVQPRSARWYAIDVPPTPPPMMTPARVPPTRRVAAAIPSRGATDHRAGDRRDPGLGGAERDRRADPGRADQHELPGRGRRRALLRADPRGRHGSPRGRSRQRAPQHGRRRRGGRRTARHPHGPRVGRVRPRVARRTNHVEREPSRGATCRGASPRSCGSSTPGPGFATTSTCSAPPSGTWRVVDERDIAIPAGYREHLAALPRIEAALAVHPLASVPCHNDLLADNYLDDGERLWLVDWEYSGNNDPTFELGNTAQELGYDDDQIRRAVRRLLRRGLPCPARPDAPPDDHVRRRLDAVGRHPGRASRPSTTTSPAGPRSAGRGRPRRSTDQTSSHGFGILADEADPGVCVTHEQPLVGSVGFPVRARPRRRHGPPHGRSLQERPSATSLLHLESVGFDGAPRHLGTDDLGREVLTWIDGDVPLPPYPAWAMTDRALTDLGRLIRRFHEATATFRSTTDDWSTQWADPAGGSVICHNDLFPENVGVPRRTCRGVDRFRNGCPRPPAMGRRDRGGDLGSAGRPGAARPARGRPRRDRAARSVGPCLRAEAGFVRRNWYDVRRTGTRALHGKHPDRDRGRRTSRGSAIGRTRVATFVPRPTTPGSLVTARRLIRSASWADEAASRRPSDTPRPGRASKLRSMRLTVLRRRRRA